MEQDQFETLIRFALQGVLAPLITVLLVLGAAIRLNRRSPLFSGLALAVGFLVGYFLAYRPALPPNEIQDYFAWFVVAALGLFAVFDLKPLPSFLGTGLKILFSLTLIMVAIKPLIAQWGGEKTLQTVIALMLVWLTIWLDLGKNAQQSDATVLSITATGGGISIMLAYSALLGQFALALGVCLAAWQLLHLFYPEIRLGNSGVAVATTILASVLLAGYYYAAMPLVQVALLLAALLAGRLMGLARHFYPDISPTRSYFATLLLAIVPVAVALLLSIQGASTGDGY